jgi:glucose-6-phosphate 1-dehydrogenase
VSAIQEGWQRLPRETMRSYVAGTWGPPAADALLVDGDAWRRL